MSTLFFNKMSIRELNHPFFIYPRGFMSEYNNYEHYRNEVKRLYQFIDNLPDLIEEKNSNGDKILIPFIIGSPMEDSLAKSNSSKENYFQFRQLFPNYINNFIQTYFNDNKFIQIIIISPDDIFSPQSNIMPLFTVYESFDFVLTNLNEYIYYGEQINIRINIFNCPVPCFEIRNNLVLRYESMISELQMNQYNINSYKQTPIDIEFIDNFYSRIKRLFSLNSYPSIIILINSWVCFKNLDGIAEKYNMFPKILELANEFNIIATEWDFIDELFYTKIVSQYKLGNKIFFGCNINYVFDNLGDLTNLTNLTNLQNLPKHIIKKNFNYNNLFDINFNTEYGLEKINIK